jgi:hypothetical protein
MCQTRIGIVLALIVLWLPSCSAGNRRADSANEIRISSRELQSLPTEPDKQPATAFAAERGGVVDPAGRDAALSATGVQPTDRGPNGQIIVIGPTPADGTSGRPAIQAESRKEPAPIAAPAAMPNGKVNRVSDAKHEEIVIPANTSTDFQQTVGGGTQAAPRTFWQSLRIFRKRDASPYAPPVEDRHDAASRPAENRYTS